jgi:hypothetical protein
VSHDTIHAPPPTEPDTGRVPSDTAEDVRAYLTAIAERDRIELQINHLRGRIEGLDVDAAQSQAFEARTARSLTSMDGKLDLLLEGMRNLASGLLETNQRVVVLEEFKRRQSATCESCKAEREAL